MNKRNSGITLVALVITIIVLLIMAGVSIALVVGDNGVLSKAKEAKTGSLVAEEKEQVNLAYSSALTKNLGNTVTAENLQTELNESVGSGKTTVTVNGNNITVLFNETGNTYNLNNGRITDSNGGTSSSGLSDAEKLKQFYVANYYNYDDLDGPHVWDTSYEVDGKEVWFIGMDDEDLAVYVLYNGSIFRVEYDEYNFPLPVSDVQFVITAEPLVIFHVDGRDVLITPSTPDNLVHVWYEGPTTAADKYYYLNDVDEPDYDRPFIGGYRTSDNVQFNYYDATGELVRVIKGGK